MFSKVNLNSKKVQPAYFVAKRVIEIQTEIN